MHSNADFVNFKKGNEIFILGISNSKWDICCQAEPILKEFSEMMKSGQILYNSKPIPTVIFKIYITTTKPYN